MWWCQKSDEPAGEAIVGAGRARRRKAARSARGVVAGPSRARAGLSGSDSSEQWAGVHQPGGGGVKESLDHQSSCRLLKKVVTLRAVIPSKSEPQARIQEQRR